MSNQDIQPSDEVLLRALAQRDLRALDTLYDRHAPMIYGLIVRIVQDRTLADELLQETMLQIWTQAVDYQGDIPATAWLYRVTRTRCLDALRWSVRNAEQQHQHYHTIYEESRSATSQELFFANSARAAGGKAGNSELAQELLHHMPEEQRVCLSLAFFGGMTQQQIADYIHMPVETVKSLLRSGLSRFDQLVQNASLHSSQEVSREGVRL